MTVSRPVAVAVITACLVAWLAAGTTAAVLVLRGGPSPAAATTEAGAGLAVLAVSAYLRGDATALDGLAGATVSDLPTDAYPGQLVVTRVQRDGDGAHIEITAEVLRAGSEGYAHDGLQTFRVRVVGDPPTVAALEPPETSPSGRHRSDTPTSTTRTGGSP